MTSDPDHVSDEEIETVRGPEGSGEPRGGAPVGRDPGDAGDQAVGAAPPGADDTGVMMDVADSGTLDQTDAVTASGATDTGVMMDSADTGELDTSDLPTPAGASDTGLMMDSRDTGTVDRTDVGEGADADEADR